MAHKTRLAVQIWTLESSPRTLREMEETYQLQKVVLHTHTHIHIHTHTLKSSSTPSHTME